MIAMLVSGYFRTKKGKTFPIWFPLILIYIILLPLYILASIVLLIISISGTRDSTAKKYLKLFFALPQIFGAMIGTNITVENEDANFEVNIT
ncbi:MAG: hypothetical protein PQJ47_00705 [Sphaerochaetaceae bacterium]|nr:hypothetical protein [Sphaerochaetaceae bacterium]